jgi:ABC-2 type transport system permease protein
MIPSTYTRYEMLRTFRNRRFFIFSLGFPVILFLLIAGPNKNAKLDGIPFPLYYMCGMVAYGTMAAVISGGGRIALEREVGWNRQLRITPLTTSAYFRSKILTGYGMAFVSIASLYILGASFGVRLPAVNWLEMTGLILVGLVPFAVLGILLGHLLSADSMGPAMGGITALFSLVGGAWGPIFTGGILRHVTQLLPSYWLVQAGKAAGGAGWPAEAWIVMAAWTAVLTRLAVVAYRRDTARA